MDITLEKIDIIRDRTGVSYKQAKEALEAAGGNVIDALIDVEEDGNKNWSESMSGWKDTITETISVRGNEAIDKLKILVQSGNVSRVRVKKDDYIIMDIPVTAGAIGAVLIPLYTAVGAVVALLTKCTIEVERPNKDIINVSDTITNTADGITSKIRNVANDIRQAAGNIQNKAENINKNTEKENIDDLTYKTTETTDDFDTTTDNKDNSYKQ
ncbi:MAG: DUF4342 domain-containing protein [Lutisporaceae bacterium]